MLLRLISWPYFRKHVLRTLLTTSGIVLGVAVFVGMRTANASVLAAFSRTIDRIAGKTELQVTAGETGFSEEILDKVQSAPTVRVAVPSIEAIVDSPVSRGTLLVLGIDMLGDRSLRDYDVDGGEETQIEDPLVFLAQPDSIMLTKAFADANRLKIGSTIALGTAEGEKTFTVRGLMKASGLASAFGGNLAIMDIYAAQKMFGRGRTFDRIDVATKPGTSLEASEQEISALLGPAFRVEPPAGRGKQFESLISGFSLMMSVSSAFALFIGMFIIYNSFSIAVTQRRTEIGILRALGATRRQIRQIFLVESLVLGSLGALVGLALGVLTARGIASFVGELVAGAYGVAQQPSEITLSPLALAFAAGVGVATSVLAALVPAQTAARLDPVHALHKGQHHQIAETENRVRVALALVFAACALACLFAGTSELVFYAGYGCAMVVPVLLGPLLSVWLTKALRPVLRWLKPVEGALAADGLLQAPRRTSGSVVALMLSLALVIGYSGMARASYFSISDWINTSLNADIFVMPSAHLEVRTTRFPAEMANEIAAVPGVARVQKFRNGRITFRGVPVMLVAVEMESVAQTIRHPPIAGDAGQMFRQAAAGQGIIVSDNLAQRQRFKLGDVIGLPTPDGEVRLPIVGILLDYTDQAGSILIDRSVFLKYWHDDSVSDFRVFVSPNARLDDVRGRIAALYSGRRQVFLLSNDEAKKYVLGVTNQWLGLTWVQIAVAVLVAILGIVNTLTVSIADRRRELGVLRAVGGLRSQIRRAIWLEALAVASIGLVLGCAVGAINLFYVLEVVRRDVAGMRLDYAFPVGTMAALIPTMLVAALVAAFWPSERAVRSPLLEALEYE